LDRKAQQVAHLEHGYPARTAYIAGLRALAGITGSVVLWIIAGGLTIALISSAGIAVFAVYGVIAVIRAKEVLVLSDAGIDVHGWRRRNIQFDKLSAVRLAYYSTRRDGEKGWMEMTVRAGGQRVVVESEISGFDRIAEAVFAAATSRNIELSAVSQRNFAVLLDDSVSIGQKTGLAFAKSAR